MTTTRGQHLIGKEIGSCVLEKLLGYGGSSAVFQARSLTSAEPVAIKVFLPRSTLDGSMRKSFYRRFLREAEAASQLDHPHILSIYAYGEHEGLPYIVMPYMAGGTLSAHVRRQGPLSLPEALRYLEQISLALDYAHKHGCIHCDVKPANILLDSAGRAALSDFGIVRMVQTDNALKPSGKRANASGEELMGTPDYVSPEQAMGEDLDGRSDVYSLGATLYFLLAGDPPFQAESPIALALMHIHEAPTPLGMLRADVTPQIDLVMAQALAKTPDERFRTASAFYEAFAKAAIESGEAALNTSKSTHQGKQQTGTMRSIAAFPSAEQSVVYIKELKRSHAASWRTGLTLGLVALLLLGCLLSALFIGMARGTQPPPHRAAPSPSQVPSDALLANQQDWPTSSTFFFHAGRYFVQNKNSTGLVAAFYADHQFTNFQLSVVTAEISGTYDGADYYGLVFRASADQASYYLFEVTASNGGQYGFLRSDGGHWMPPLASGAIPDLLNPQGQSNVLSVTARGSTFTFAINGQQIGKIVRDTTRAALASGSIGLVVEEPGTEVAFSHLLISSLP